MATKIRPIVFKINLPPPLPPIPEYTVRAKIRTGAEPSSGGPPLTFTLVDAAQNIWDITSETYFSNYIGYGLTDATEIIDWNPGNTSSLSRNIIQGSTKSYLTKISLSNFGNITSLAQFFANIDTYLPVLKEIHLSGLNNVTNLTDLCASDTVIETVSLSGTHNVTNIKDIFVGCTGLKAIPDFDVSSVTDCSVSFYNCNNVESGALNMYQKLSALDPLPTYTNGTFYGCGSNTVTGAAELAQIPSSWGGTGT